MCKVLWIDDEYEEMVQFAIEANKVERCFDKTSRSDVIQLFKEMKIAASEQADTQLKHEYGDLLEVCSDHRLGSDQFISLFTLIKHIKYVE